ncbi:sugar ABC transporter ATP-binding protein [Halioglobus maricola]|uniref:Sugar ABC transporter ATP-binding protein n=1 Tax=Halioglobus maricola TaxID=2601894 RepID=A0A5P9NLT7_9GAMM|nr:sugar ABC transporter ATP-binding protein [Halioglobus maricola]QFU76781.1 sugar ABC transporter ATP-binding protein [Halioglobus maricola]
MYKSFASPVLTNLDLDILPGEIHALMGSNGAGKSTLCNLITGIHPPNAGNMEFDGQPHAPATLKAAETIGIQMVMQELNLFPTLSVAENLSFSSLGGRAGLINHSSVVERARHMLAQLEMDDMDPETPVSALGVGHQQLIEIARAISQDVKLLILDEPTASLTDPQIETLFKRLNAMREKGVSVIYISHRMDEIARIADRVSVLRDGELVATLAIADAAPDTIVNLMAGELPEQDEHSSHKTSAETSAEVLLRVEGLSVAGSIDNVSFDIRAGEVLGIGGLIGSGRTELLRAIFGADKASGGRLKFASDGLSSSRLMQSPREAIAAGIGLVVEDRKDQGLLLGDTISSNICLGQLQGLSNRAGVIAADKEAAMATDAAQELQIKYDDLQQPVTQLSGGNQQKVLIARWLLNDLPILLFDEPTRGVDARAKASIQALLRELAAKGKAVVVVSSETDELIKVSDRILVMSNGRHAGEFNAADVTEEQLLEASFKHYSKAQHA